MIATVWNFLVDMGMVLYGLSMWLCAAVMVVALATGLVQKIKGKFAK